MPSALLPLTAAARQVPANNRWPFCAARVGKRLWSFFGNLSAIETKAIANIADPPKPAGKLGEGPSLAEVCETRLLLNDVVAGGRGIVIEVGLQTAELIQNIVDLAVERSDIGGLRWLPTRRRGRGPDIHGKAAEKKTCGKGRWVFMVPHRGSAPLAPAASCSSACTALSDSLSSA